MVFACKLAGCGFLMRTYRLQAEVPRTGSAFNQSERATLLVAELNRFNLLPRRLHRLSIGESRAPVAVSRRPNLIEPLERRVRALLADPLPPPV